jgi:hypothetical protein
MRLDDRMVQAAAACAAYTSPAHPTGESYGSYVSSKFAACGWGHKTFADAFDYVTRLSANARRDGTLDDFHAAIATREGHAIAVW